MCGAEPPCSPGSGRPDRGSSGPRSSAIGSRKNDCGGSVSRSCRLLIFKAVQALAAEGASQVVAECNGTYFEMLRNASEASAQSGKEKQRCGEGEDAAGRRWRQRSKWHSPILDSRASCLAIQPSSNHAVFLQQTNTFNQKTSASRAEVGMTGQKEVTVSTRHDRRERESERKERHGNAQEGNIYDKGVADQQPRERERDERAQPNRGIPKRGRAPSIKPQRQSHERPPLTDQDDADATNDERRARVSRHSAGSEPTRSGSSRPTRPRHVRHRLHRR